MFCFRSGTASHCVNGKDIAQLKWQLSGMRTKSLPHNSNFFCSLDFSLKIVLYSTHSGVRLGEWDQSSDNDCDENYCSPPVVDVPVVDHIPHENYVPTSRAQENDIALLRLARPVEFTEWIKPICLPIAPSTRNINYDDYSFIVAGWGKTEKASSSNIKLKVELLGVPLEQCNRVYRAQNVVLSQKQLCAGGQPGKDSCRGMLLHANSFIRFKTNIVLSLQLYWSLGDSGGPLMALDKSDRLKPYHFLAGVVSFGPSPCGLENWPGTPFLPKQLNSVVICSFVLIKLFIFLFTFRRIHGMENRQINFYFSTRCNAFSQNCLFIYCCFLFGI